MSHYAGVVIKKCEGGKLFWRSCSVSSHVWQCSTSLCVSRVLQGASSAQERGQTQSRPRPTSPECASWLDVNWTLPKYQTLWERIRREHRACLLGPHFAEGRPCRSTSLIDPHGGGPTVHSRRLTSAPWVDLAPYESSLRCLLLRETVPVFKPRYVSSPHPAPLLLFISVRESTNRPCNVLSLMTVTYEQLLPSRMEMLPKQRPLLLITDWCINCKRSLGSLYPRLPDRGWPGLPGARLSVP